MSFSFRQPNNTKYEFLILFSQNSLHVFEGTEHKWNCQLGSLNAVPEGQPPYKVAHNYFIVIYLDNCLGEKT